jgi:uncharacterized protein YutE (UPF0331/DUF86 family)
MDDDHKPVFFGMLADPRKSKYVIPEERIAEELLDEIFDPNPLRSHVITLHLYVEYWLDKLLEAVSEEKIHKLSFSRKLEILKNKNIIEGDLYDNIQSINKLRNIYAHELDLQAANRKVQALLNEMKVDPYFVTSDKDHFRSICLQSIMLLEATFANGCKSPRLNEFPYEEIRQKLLTEGKIHWQECDMLSKTVDGYISTYKLKCPICQDGVITREKDDTPGFRDSFITACTKCGLTGDGMYLEIRIPKE